jgi:hypothetical protein
MNQANGQLMQMTIQIFARDITILSGFLERLLKASKNIPNANHNNAEATSGRKLTGAL